MVVWVRLAGDAGQIPDCLVVGPGGVGEPDVAGLHVVGEEESTEVVGTGTSDGLHGTNASLGLFFALLTLESEHQIAGDAQEGHITLDGGIFMAEEVVVLDEGLLGLLDGGKGPGLAIVGSVDTNTQADLMRVGIGKVGTVQGEDLIRGDRGHIETGVKLGHDEIECFF